MSKKRSDTAVTTSRRRLLLLAGLLPFSAVLGKPRRPLTPAQTAGPFYPSPAPAAADADLTRLDGATVSGRGEPLQLSGRVLDKFGRPITNALVEAWQCDTEGRYHHPRDGDPAQRDPSFQGYARQRVGPNGRYSLRCIKPVAYTGRTPHIHVAIRLDSQIALVTQLYIAGDPRNKADFIYRGLGPERQKLVTLELTRAKAGWLADFDPVVAAV